MIAANASTFLIIFAVALSGLKQIINELRTEQLRWQLDGSIVDLQPPQVLFIPPHPT